MSRIFLSHSSTDELEAVALKEWLTQNGWDDIFLDLDPQRGLLAGERWQEALRRAADRCEAVVFIVTPAWAKSKWCLTEFLLAKSLHKRIFGAILKPVDLKELPVELTAEWQLSHLVGDGPKSALAFVHKGVAQRIELLTEGLTSLRNGLEDAGLDARHFSWPPPDDPKRSPYRGLVPLEDKDAAVYFGRDAQIVRGLDALRGMRGTGVETLFVILGPSGSGKSSFLRAGLLPRLKRDDRHFLPLDVIRPERQAISGELGLAGAIHKARVAFGLSHQTLGGIKTALASGSGQLSRLLLDIQHAACERLRVNTGGTASPTLLLSVDQAEELFNPDATSEAGRLLALVGASLRDASPERPSLIVAFTIRSDRFEPLQTAPELAGLKSTVFDDLKPMPLQQFKEVITGPARRATLAGNRLDVTPDLTDQLLADCVRGADTLPLLSLALSRLYRDYGSDGNLRLDEYQAMGGMASVVNSEVESVLVQEGVRRELQLEQLHAAFVPWLATINPETDEPMRRVARYVDLPPESHTLLDALAEKRLLLIDLRGGEKTVEVAHEALFRQWEALAGWLRAERDDLKLAHTLEQATQDWENNGHREEWLWIGERVTNAEGLAAKPRFRQRLDRCREFLLACRRVEDAKRAEERRRQQSELEAAQRLAAEQKARADAEQGARVVAEASTRRIRARSRALAAALLFMLIAAVALGYFYQQSRLQFREANSLRLLADSQAIASGTRPGNDERVLLQLLAAWRTAPGAEQEEALRAMVEAHSGVEKIFSASEGLTAVAFSPDGKRILVGSNEGTLRLWDVTSGGHIGGPIPAHEGQVRSIAFSPDGMRFLSGGTDKKLRQWDAKTGKAIGEPLQGHEDEVTRVAYSPDGTHILSGSADKTLRQWDAKTGQPVGEPMRGHEDDVAGIAFSPDGLRIVSGSWDKTLRVWNATTGLPIDTPIARQDRAVTALALSPDGARIILATDDGTLGLWDASGGRRLGAPMTGHTGQVDGIAFSPDGSRVISSSMDKTLRLWEGTSGQPIGEPMRGHKKWIPSVVFSPDGRHILSGSMDKTVRLWDANQERVFGEPLNMGGLVKSVAFSPDGTRIVSTGFETLQLWDARTGQPIGKPINGHMSDVRAVAFSPDGKRIVSGGDDGTVRMWDAKSGQPIGAPLLGHQNQVASVAFSPDGQRIVSGGGYVLEPTDNTLRMWDAATGRPVGEPMPGHMYPVNSVAFSPDGTRIVSSSWETLQLWDAGTRQRIGEPIRGHKKDVRAVAFSPDGKRIVSGGDDGTVRLWDARSGQPVGEPMSGHQGGVNSVAFSPDGRSIVSGGSDNTVRVWDVAIGRVIGGAIRGHTAEVTSVAVSPDGRRIVSAGYDGTVRFWPSRPVWSDLLCAKLTRNMSHREWREWVSPAIPYVEQCSGLLVSSDEPDQKKPE